MLSVRAQVRQPASLVHAILEAPRLLRFAMTGIIGASVQLGLLVLLTAHQWEPHLANAVAFILSAQVTFAASSFFTWRERFVMRKIPQRWALFHASIATTAVVNMTIFTLAHHFVPALVASALGIASAAAGNFLAGDRLVFRAKRITAPEPPWATEVEWTA